MNPHSLAVAFAVLLGAAGALAPRLASAAPGGGIAAQALPSALTPVANWRHPYRNIDPRNDAGNNTGDWMVERLNQQQLNRIQRGYDPMPRRFLRRPPPYGYYGPRY